MVTWRRCSRRWARLIGTPDRIGGVDADVQRSPDVTCSTRSAASSRCPAAQYQRHGVRSPGHSASARSIATPGPCQQGRLRCPERRPAGGRHRRDRRWRSRTSRTGGSVCGGHAVHRFRTARPHAATRRRASVRSHPAPSSLHRARCLRWHRTSRKSSRRSIHRSGAIVAMCSVAPLRVTATPMRMNT